MNRVMMGMVGTAPYCSRRLLWRLRRSLGLRPTVRLANGVRWKLPLGDLFASDVYVTDGNVDLGCEHMLMAYLRDTRPTGVAMDVGAHSGYYSLLFSTEVEKVYAFEPDVRNFPLMAEAAALRSNIELVPMAVGDYCGAVRFSQAVQSDVSHIEPGAAAPGEASAGLSVPITTLDAFAAERGLRVAAVKVDVEGFDILVLQGGLQTARRDRPVFSVEFGIEAGRANSWEALAEFLAAARYQVWAADLDCAAARPTCRFARRSVEELQTVWTKMLFLVPEEDGWFPAFATCFPQWGRDRFGAMDVDAWRVRPGGPKADS